MTQYPSSVTIREFEDSLSTSQPPLGISDALVALWWEAKGDWHKAHDAVQKVETTDAAWVHAYLHRKEGDLSNAAYWYSRAGKPEADDDLTDEWRRIVAGILRAAD